MSRRLFTPAEANRTLPLVRQIVGDIIEKGQAYRALESRPEPEAEDRRQTLQDELVELFDELERIGCSYKDWGFEMGIVDFPAEIDGRLVLLCWRSDEPAVTHYHTLEGGFAGRKPIPAALLEA